jgi:hypothetical protein
VALYGSNILEITESDLERVAQKIYQNECNANVENLIVWNRGEEFLSAGIGHFIWYPRSNEPHKYVESFPKLIAFMEQNGVTLPYFLHNNRANPWQSREAYLRDSRLKKDLQRFMEKTIAYQTKYLIERLNQALPNMMHAASNEAHFKTQFLRVFNSPGGLYAIVDYVNFKGEGIDKRERYNKQGWGLLQVIECMQGTQQGAQALDHFSECAKNVLLRRINNAPKERNEKRWINGWMKRVESYRVEMKN